MSALRQRLPWLRATVRFRLAALYLALFMLAGAGTLAVIYVLFSADSGQSVTYHGAARVAARQYITYRGGALITLIHRSPTDAVSVVQHTGADGRSVIHPPGSTGGAGAVRRLTKPKPTVSRKTVTRVVSVQVKIPRSEVLRIQHAADLHRLLVESALVFALMTIPASIIGWLFAGRALRPLRAITATARRLSSSDLQERLAFDGPRDELRELADTLDGFLARLERAFEAQRRFVHHASHELRTPLARQRALLEVALADPHPTVDSLRVSHARVLATEQEQERLIDGLLTLARSDEPIDQGNPVDLEAVVGNLVELRRQDILERGLSISTCLGPARTYGDQALLERLIANLLDNAIEHNVAGGAISISTESGAEAARLSVSNSGPMLSAEDLDVLTRPWEQRHQIRLAARGHHGLGLAIVQSVATVHGADVSMSCRDSGGLAVVVEFPIGP